MFCTDKERRTCQIEKMGCEGCFYNNDKNQIYKLIAVSDENKKNRCKAIIERRK